MHLVGQQCGNHTVYINRTAKKVSTIPRHSDVNEELARKICKDLQVPDPTKRDRRSR
jgi:hypothetical protein